MVARQGIITSSLETELQLVDLRSRLRRFTTIKRRVSVASFSSLSEDDAESTGSSVLAVASMAVRKLTIETQATLARSVQLR